MQGWNHKAFGKRLALARAELEQGDVSLREVARRSGVSPSELSRIERGGRPSIGIVNLLALCDVLGVRLEWIVYGEGEKHARAISPATLAPPAPSSVPPGPSAPPSTPVRRLPRERVAR